MSTPKIAGTCGALAIELWRELSTALLECTSVSISLQVASEQYNAVALSYAVLYLTNSLWWMLHCSKMTSPVQGRTGSGERGV